MEGNGLDAKTLGTLLAALWILGNAVKALTAFSTQKWASRSAEREDGIARALWPATPGACALNPDDRSRIHAMTQALDPNAGNGLVRVRDLEQHKKVLEEIRDSTREHAKHAEKICKLQRDTLTVLEDIRTNGNG